MTPDSTVGIMVGMMLGVAICATVEHFARKGERILADEARKKAKCPECRFYQRTSINLRSDDRPPLFFGYCRKGAPRAPKMDGAHEGRWPTVWNDESCGAFEWKDDQ